MQMVLANAFLSTALARQVGLMQSPPSVSLFPLLTFEPSDF